CFEIGALLVFIPWLKFWDENFFLYYAATRLHWQGLIDLMHSGYMRGGVSGLGIINLVIGFWEIKNFNRTVSTISEEEKEADEPTKSVPVLNNRSTDPQNDITPEK